MITVLNRKELTITFDMNERSRVCNILADHGIDYQIKTVNRMSPSPISAGTRGRTGTMGQNYDAAIEYIIYVKKSDYGEAQHLIIRG